MILTHRRFKAWLKSVGLKSPGLKSSWLKSPGLKGLGLKLGVEKSRVEMSFNRMRGLDYVGLGTPMNDIDPMIPFFFRKGFSKNGHRENAGLHLTYFCE